VVAVGKNTPHDELRARLLGSLWRTRKCPVHFVRVLPKDTPVAALEAAERALERFAQEETPGAATAEILASDDDVAALADIAHEGELLVLGLTRRQGRRLFGRRALKIAHETPATTLLISPKLSGFANLVETEALRRFPTNRPPP
jgi:nucleotide-binding universal stress UspA family protein